MRVISKKTLSEFCARPNGQGAKKSLDAWYAEATVAKWDSPADIKAQFRSASILKNNRIVFNIAGNKYRLIVQINYDLSIVFIRFVGTHKEYDKIDAEVV